MPDRLKFFSCLDTEQLIADPAGMADRGGLNHDQMEAFPSKK
jgi:hypothetical protein